MSTDNATDNASNPHVECYFCGRRERINEAVDVGWLPSFIEIVGDVENDSPVCPQCVETHLELDSFGEYVHKLPTPVIPAS